MAHHLRNLSIPHRLSAQARVRRANDRAIIENPLSEFAWRRGGKERLPATHWLTDPTQLQLITPTRNWKKTSSNSPKTSSLLSTMMLSFEQRGWLETSEFTTRLRDPMIRIASAICQYSLHLMRSGLCDGKRTCHSARKECVL